MSSMSQVMRLGTIFDVLLDITVRKRGFAFADIADSENDSH